jgi:Fe-S cluster assembly protein SufD
MSALLDQLLAQASPLQAANRNAALLCGLPQARDERWRYSTLRALNERQFQQRATDASALPQPLRALIAAMPSRIVIIDGRYSAEWSCLGEHADRVRVILEETAATAPRHLPFALAAAASATSRMTLHIAESTAGGDDDVLNLVTVATDAARDTIVQTTLQLHLAPRASLQIARHRLHADGGNALFNEWRQIELSDGAKLTWCEHGEEADAASVVTGTSVAVGQDATLEFAEVAAGAALYRHDLDVALHGDRGAFSVRGCTAVGKRRHADIAIDVQHVARDTRADIVWRGLADQRAHAIFGGRLLVAVGADGSDTALSNKNLLLSPHAEIDTRPVLEIHADEVKAAHGATVGQLDERSLFYLRARGIALADARRLLTLAFAREPLSAIAAAPLRELLLAALARSLPE